MQFRIICDSNMSRFAQICLSLLSKPTTAEADRQDTAWDAARPIAPVVEQHHHKPLASQISGVGVAVELEGNVPRHSQTVCREAGRGDCCGEAYLGYTYMHKYMYI